MDWRHKAAVLNFLCGPLVTRRAHVAARTMLMIESSLSDTVRWVASSGYVANDNGSGLEVEMPQNLYFVSTVCVSVFLCVLCFVVLV